MVKNDGACMLISQAELSRMCGVSRPAICKASKSDKIILDSDGKIDTDNPVNRSYISRHNGIGKQIGSSEKKEQEPKEKRKSNKPTESVKDEKIASMNKRQYEQQEEDERIPTGFYTKEEEEIIEKRHLFEALKVKADAELKNIQIDEKNGALADRELIEFAFTELEQAIQTHFFDIAITQSIDICALLGKHDYETDVQDIIAKGNQQRIQEIKRILRKIIYGKYVRHEEEQIDSKENKINKN